MMKRILILVSILFVAISAVGCSGSGAKDVKELNEGQQIVLDNLKDFAIVGSGLKTNLELSKADVDKFFKFAKTLVANSKEIDSKDLDNLELSDIDKFLTLANTSGNQHDFDGLGIVKTAKGKIYVTMANANAKDGIVYEVNNPKKYFSQLDNLFKDLF